MWGHLQPIGLTFASGASPPPGSLRGSPGSAGRARPCPLLQEHWGQWGRLVLAKQFWRGKCCVSTGAPQAPAFLRSWALLLQRQQLPGALVLAQTDPTLRGLGGGEGRDASIPAARSSSNPRGC